MKTCKIKKVLITLIAVSALTGSLYGQDDDFNKVAHKIYSKDTDSIKILVNSGIDVNITNSAGAALLSLACSFEDNFDVVRCLVELGADINAVGSHDGSTPIMWAPKSSAETVEYLLSKGAKVNVVAKDGTTAFTKAVFNVLMGDSFEILDILLKAGADINLTTSEGDGNGYTAINYAARWGHVELTKYLIMHKADVNHQAKDGETAMMIAAKEGYPGVVSLLLDAGASSKLKDNEGRTALDIALDEGKDEVVKLFK